MVRAAGRRDARVDPAKYYPPDAYREPTQTWPGISISPREMLVNDFGAINIDAALVESVRDSTITLTNGCVCCEIRDDLVSALTQLVDTTIDLDHILFEASGVADPAGTLPVIERPTWLPTSAWAWPTRALATQIGRIAVTDTGTGPTLLTLLFVHVGAWSFVWRDLIADLHTRFRCVAIDPPGCGLSDRVQTSPTLEQAAQAVTAVIDALDLRDVTLVAHELGGPFGFAAASRPADRIAALKAINCFAWRPSGPAFRSMLAVMGSATARESDAFTGWFPSMTSTRFGVGRHWKRVDRRVFRAGIDQPGRRAWHSYFRDAGNADTLYAEIQAGLTGPLEKLPLLTIFGQHNDPLGFQPKWKALFPDAHQLTVKSGNHFPMCDAPQFVAGAIDTLAGSSLAK